MSSSLNQSINLSSKLQALPQYSLLQKVSQVLIQNNYKAYLAGGAVRDLIIGRTPHDFDIATDARPEQIELLFDKTIPVGKKFGIIVVVIEGLQIEVASFRKDGVYKDSRHPDEVEFSEPEYDAGRRDFTINALFLDLKSGQLIDYVGGVEDLHKKIIKTVGDPNKRFAEDALRLLRAVRFCCDLGYNLDSETYNCVVRLFKNTLLVSRERILQEIIKIFKNLDQLKDTNIIKDCLFFETLFADLKINQSQRDILISQIQICAKKIKVSQHNFTSSIASFKKRNLNSLNSEIIFWALMLKNQNSHFEVDSFLKNQKCSNKDVQLTTQALKVIRMLGDQPQNKIITGEYIFELYQDGGVEALFLMYCLDIVDLNFCNNCLQLEQLPAPFLNGHELLSLGLKGAALGQVQKQIYFLQLEGKIADKSEAMDWVQKNSLQSK